jgi:hypothetical protein
MGLVIVISFVVLLIVSLSVILIYSTRINVKNVKEEQKNIGKKIESRSSESNKHTNFVGNKLNMEISKMNDEIKNRQNRDKRLAHEALVELREQINDSLDVQRSNLKSSIDTANSNQTYLNGQRQLAHAQKRNIISNDISSLGLKFTGDLNVLTGNYNVLSNTIREQNNNFQRTFAALSNLSSNADTAQIESMNTMTSLNTYRFDHINRTLNNFFDITLLDMVGEGEDGVGFSANFESWFDGRYFPTDTDTDTESQFNGMRNMVGKMDTHLTDYANFSNDIMDQQRSQDTANSNLTNKVTANETEFRRDILENSSSITDLERYYATMSNMLSNIGITEVETGGQITLQELHYSIQSNANNMSIYQSGFDTRVGSYINDTVFDADEFKMNLTIGGETSRNTLQQMYNTLQESINETGTTAINNQEELQTEIILIGERVDDVEEKANNYYTKIVVDTLLGDKVSNNQELINTKKVCFGNECIQMKDTKLSICNQNGENCHQIWDHGEAPPVVPR